VAAGRCKLLIRSNLLFSLIRLIIFVVFHCMCIFFCYQYAFLGCCIFFILFGGKFGLLFRVFVYDYIRYTRSYFPYILTKLILIADPGIFIV
jgi:hypothetical protein